MPPLVLIVSLLLLLHVGTSCSLSPVVYRKQTLSSLSPLRSRLPDPIYGGINSTMLYLAYIKFGNQYFAVQIDSGTKKEVISHVVFINVSHFHFAVSRKLRNVNSVSELPRKERWPMSLCFSRPRVLRLSHM